MYMLNETESAVSPFFFFFFFFWGGGLSILGGSVIPDNLEYVRRYLFGPVGENDLNECTVHNILIVIVRIGLHCNNTKCKLTPKEVQTYTYFPIKKPSAVITVNISICYCCSYYLDQYNDIRYGDLLLDAYWATLLILGLLHFENNDAHFIVLFFTACFTYSLLLYISCIHKMLLKCLQPSDYSVKVYISVILLVSSCSIYCSCIMSRGMIFPVRLAKPQTSLRIRAV